MQLSDQLRLLKAVNSEKRVKFDGWISRAHIEEALGLSSDEAFTIAGDLVQMGYLATQGFGQIDIKLTTQGNRYLAQETKLEQNRKAKAQAQSARQDDTLAYDADDFPTGTVTQL